MSSGQCFVVIASSGDDTYLRRGTLTAIRSVRRTNPGTPIVVLHHDLTLEQQGLFSGTIVKQIHAVDFPLSSWSKQARPDLPQTCFLTAFVEQIEDFDIAIYVDADAVVLEPLDDLFRMDVPMAARVMDDHLLVEHFENGHNVLEQEGIHAEHALNNGLVRFDLRYWRANSLLSLATRLFRKYGPDTFRLADQSLLNLIAYKTHTLVPVSRIYNFCRYPDMLRMEHSLVKNDLGLTAPHIQEGVVKVVHWTGPLKPWSPGAGLVDDRQVALCLACYEQFAE
jgi:lipopolysaccharide biosynthesis glycosyltransferase